MCFANEAVVSSIFFIRADVDANGSFEELGNLSYIGAEALEQMLNENSELFWCPSAPKAFQAKMKNSYLHGLIFSDQNHLSRLRVSMKREVNNRGMDASILACSVHDELHVAPRERDVHPTLAKPLHQELCLDGRVQVRRVNGPRDYIFLTCQQSEINEKSE